MSRDTGVPSEYVEHFVGACHGGDLLEHFRDCGARWKRGGPGWHTVEPEPGEYDFSAWDELLADADEHGVEVMPVLAYTPEWASTAPDDATEPHHYPPSEDAVEHWRAFVEAFVDRYPDITHVEVWNEPNLRKFLRVDEERRHEMYVDRILEPAAEVLHDAGVKVAAPSVTTEAWGWSVEENVDRTETWLSYEDAHEHVDYLSVHYTKGDTEKLEVDGAGNLQPYLEWVHEEYVSTGKLDGIWNTEEGFTAVEAGDQGFVALEPWERPPYPQWVPKYLLPWIHWGIECGWDDRDDYKLFWYRMGTETHAGTLDPCNLLDEREDGLVPSERGETLRTLVDLFTDADRVDTFDGDVTVGFGLYPAGESEFTLSPHEFTSYAFTLDGDLFVATWLDLPGIDLTDPDHSTIQATVTGLDPSTDPDVSVVDYRTGESEPVEGHEWDGDELRLSLPRTGDPVRYTRVSL
jgi:hypothetical protein